MLKIPVIMLKDKLPVIMLKDKLYLFNYANFSTISMQIFKPPHYLLFFSQPLCLSRIFSFADWMRARI